MHARGQHREVHVVDVVQSPEVIYAELPDYAFAHHPPRLLLPLLLLPQHLLLLLLPLLPLPPQQLLRVRSGVGGSG